MLAPQLSLAKIRLAAYGLRRTSLPRAWVNLRQTVPSGEACPLWARSWSSTAPRKIAFVTVGTVAPEGENAD